MPAFLLMLIGGLAGAAASITGRVLIALGIGFAAFTGVSTMLTALQAQVISNLGSAPATVITVMSLLKIDVCVSIIFSAVAARLVISGLTSGTITKLVLK